MKTISSKAVWQAWRRGDEIAVLDVRDEAEHAVGHPLFAASLSIDRIELEIYERIPNRDVLIVCFDDGDGRAESAAERIVELGYQHVTLLDGGLAGWRRAGLELFADVNAPSKAFGELVEATCHPELLSPDDLRLRIDRNEPLVIVDARRFDEFATMSIPRARNVPGGELAYRIESVVTGPDTPVVVNCAGRTRSIIGAQTLRNLGIGNPVAALRNGTIGWTLAGYELERGASARFDLTERPSAAVARAARVLAQRSGVIAIDSSELSDLQADGSRTTYFLDVREPAEFLEAHLVGFRHAPGGQLVQETDSFMPVRGATVVLADNDGVRASVTGSWLAQMGWMVKTVRIDTATEYASGPTPRSLPPLPEVPLMTSHTLAGRLESSDDLIIDLSSSTNYRRGHIPGSAFALRRELGPVLAAYEGSGLVVLASEDGTLARFAARDLATSQYKIVVLDGGMTSWLERRLPVEQGSERWLSAPSDRYRRPYEGTDVDPAAMAAYLEWEYGLVAQLERDGSHRFAVLCSP